MKIALLGDIALFGRASIDGNPKWKDYFVEIANCLSEYDYVVGNLESPFSLKKNTWGAKSVYLCSAPENIEVLKMLHVNAVTLANNHMYDYGKEGFELTQLLLDKAGIAWFGVNGKEHLLEKDGNKLAFTGYCCYTTNPLKCVAYGEYGINEFDLSKAQDVLTKYQEKGFLNIAAVHAGIEHVNYPSLDTIAVARRLARKIPMVYYGHHPHVAQAVIQEKDSLIAYSLGNFCFDDTYISGDKPLVELSEDNRKSFILVVTIEKNMICNYEIVPIYIAKDRIRVGIGTDERQIESFRKNMEAMQPEEYETMRKEQRMTWIRPRVAARNLGWVLKRLRPRYFILMLTYKQNARKYVEHVKSQLNHNI